jgi:hypothetical protein
VLDANEGDFEKTMEMFKPINPAAKQEHQKRPPSRAGEGPPKDQLGNIHHSPRASANGRANAYAYVGQSVRMLCSHSV